MKQSKKRIQNTQSIPEKPLSVEHTIQYVWGVVIAVIAFVLFANTIGHGYVLDDSGAINENRYVLEGFSGIPKLMTVEFWHFSNIHLGYYRPLSLITFAIENQFVAENPQLSHFINVLLFAFAGFMLFILLSKVFKSKHLLFAFSISLLFVSHPIHTEIVANIKGRDELLSFLNVLLMLWFSLRFIDTQKKVHLILSLLFCYLGMLSKETALVGVVLLPVFIYYYSDFTIKECLLKSIAPLLIVGLFFIQKNYLLDTPSIIPSDIVNYPYTDNAVKFPTAFLLFAYCLKLLVLPHPLRYDYSFNHIPAVDFSSFGALIGLVLFSVGIYYTYQLAIKKKILGFAMSIFYITLIPSLAFTLLRGGIFAERFLFVPTLGFCIAVIFGLQHLLKVDFSELPSSILSWLKQNVKYALCVGMLFALYSFKTIDRNTAWADNITLFSTDIKTGPNSAQNQRHLGNQYVYLASNETDKDKKEAYGRKAIRALKESLRIHPRFGESYYLIGMVYQVITPVTDSAIYYYNKAIEHAPGYAIPYYNIGVLYQGMGKNNVASFYYNEAIKYNPEYLEPKQAAEALKKVGIDVHMNPLKTQIDLSDKNKNSTYYFKLGNHYASQSDYVNAAKSYSQSIALDSNNKNAYINLMNCYGILKQFDKGIEVANKILSKDPKNALALKNLAVLYSNSGDKEKAEIYIKKLREVENL